MSEGAGSTFDGFKRLHKRILSRERESASGFIDITDAAERSVAQLRTEILASGGTARILVHPKYNPTDTIHPLTSTYTEQLQTFLHDSKEITSPLIVFEEEEKVKELQALLLPNAATFLVRTVSDDPTPATRALKQNIKEFGDYDYHTKDRANRQIAQLFKQVGINKVIVGGRYLLVRSADQPGNDYYFRRFLEEANSAASSKQWEEQRVFPTGCLGNVIENVMREGIDVEVSAAVSPENNVPFFSDRHLFQAAAAA